MAVLMLIYNQRLIIKYVHSFKSNSLREEQEQLVHNEASVIMEKVKFTEVCKCKWVYKHTRTDSLGWTDKDEITQYIHAADILNLYV